MLRPLESFTTDCGPATDAHQPHEPSQQMEFSAPAVLSLVGDKLCEAFASGIVEQETAEIANLLFPRLKFLSLAALWEGSEGDCQLVTVSNLVQAGFTSINFYGMDESIAGVCLDSKSICVLSKSAPLCCRQNLANAPDVRLAFDTGCCASLATIPIFKRQEQFRAFEALDISSPIGTVGVGIEQGASFDARELDLVNQLANNLSEKMEQLVSEFLPTLMDFSEPFSSELEDDEVEEADGEEESSKEGSGGNHGDSCHHDRRDDNDDNPASTSSLVLSSSVLQCQQDDDTTPSEPCSANAFAEHASCHKTASSTHACNSLQADAAILTDDSGPDSTGLRRRTFQAEDEMGSCSSNWNASESTSAELYESSPDKHLDPHEWHTHPLWLYYNSERLEHRYEQFYARYQSMLDLIACRMGLLGLLCGWLSFTPMSTARFCFGLVVHGFTLLAYALSREWYLQHRETLCTVRAVLNMMLHVVYVAMPAHVAGANDHQFHVGNEMLALLLTPMDNMVRWHKHVALQLVLVFMYALPLQQGWSHSVAQVSVAGAAKVALWMGLVGFLIPVGVTYTVEAKYRQAFRKQWAGDTHRV